MVLLPTISAPATIFEKVYIDIIFMPRSDSYRYIVCAKDNLTGVVKASALKENKAKALAKFLWTKIYCQYGAIGQIVTNNGPEVKGAFKHLAK